ncbi:MULTISPECIES: DUF488 domain-containing protein [unclassified Nostoc]|uniref:DUF488 domain-containing protein n=1 Tax=unclassified Nostoc TaxID=2593658 RepID=UPI002AD269DB|nr:MULTISPECIES: DUF488 domain-containing protein [unclassified Nostoc]MDZ8034860.1 DUF488 domain-containing protein [Nostoc sp. DedSLP04]MDZ8139287.1 DUF488 domain-containing protein [Nostoc sp. DedQUE04]
MEIIYTIGFTKKSAQHFFELLKNEKIDLIADVRLNNTGQLAGFTKKKDLEYFLSLIEIKYEHWTHFAPTKDIRDKYHTTGEWEEYQCSYRSLIKNRKALEQLNKTLLNNQRICLLCSEHTPEKCHRRIASEMLADMSKGMKIIHL